MMTLGDGGQRSNNDFYQDEESYGSLSDDEYRISFVGETKPVINPLDN